MIQTVGLKKNIQKYKINSNLININKLTKYNSSVIKPNFICQSYRFEHTNTNKVCNNKCVNEICDKLTQHEHKCVSKIVSQDEFYSNIRNIIKEELKELKLINNNDNDNDLENIELIKSIVKGSLLGMGISLSLLFTLKYI